MARARPGLEKAINEILERRGVDGKRLSYRQAERLTGLSTATISELAKGNARTAESLRRFALALDEDATRLMLLAGFVPEDDSFLRKSQPQEIINQTVNQEAVHQEGFAPAVAAPEPNASNLQMSLFLDAEERACLQRLEQGLAQLPPGTDRALWTKHLSHCADLLERFVEQGLGV